MKHIYLVLSIIVLSLLSYTGIAQVTTFSYTGTIETYTVPGGVSSISIQAYGGQGGNDNGGMGAGIYGEFAVVPGTVLNVVVGQQGIVNNCGGPDASGGGGGGSFVWNPADDALPMIAAGAGGGGNENWGGLDCRDGLPGQAEENGTSGAEGLAAGGIGGNGGAGDAPSGTGSGGGGWLTPGQNSTYGTGCTGGTTLPLFEGGAGSTSFDPGGEGGFGGGGGAVCGCGGGGGYSGGAGGNGSSCRAGGGGGGSYNGGTEQSNATGVRSGNGEIIITVLCMSLSLEDVDTDICEGDAIALNASSETGGIVMWDGGIENDVEFIPGDAGSYTYTATSTSGSDCNLVVEIVVHGLPAIVANADPETVCFGQELTLSGSGGASYVWSPGDIENGEPFVPALGIMTYTVEGEDWYGCFNTAEVTVEVIDAPVVTANATDDKICLGESVTLTGSGAVTYEWDMGVEDGVSFTPETIGTFVYNVDGFVDGEGCFGEASIEITVNELPIIESFITIEELLGDDGSINITVSGGTPAYSFDWDNDGTGDFDDPEDLTGISGDTYTVVVSDANGCEDTESILVDSKLGISHDQLGKLIIYPNPSTDFISILQEGQFTYTITSINGEIVMTGNGFNSEQVDLSKMASGSYFINVRTDDKLATIKVIKE